MVAYRVINKSSWCFIKSFRSMFWFLSSLKHKNIQMDFIRTRIKSYFSLILLLLWHHTAKTCLVLNGTFIFKSAMTSFLCSFRWSSGTNIRVSVVLPCFFFGMFLNKLKHHPGRSWWSEMCCLDRNLCRFNPCLNGGICSENRGVHECLCPPQYSGRNCETGSLHAALVLTYSSIHSA